MIVLALSNKRHSAAKLQNDVRRTKPRPLVMSIQLSSVAVFSIGLLFFGRHVAGFDLPVIIQHSEWRQ